MKTTNLLPISIILAATLASCATWRPAARERDPFADSGQYESLASAPFETARRRPAAAPAETTDRSTLVSLPNPAAPFVNPALEMARKQGSLEAELKHGFPEDAPKAERAIETPDDSYAALVRGNERFKNGNLRAENRDESRRRSIASVQRPHAVVLSCSDSRVPPELVFDQGLGDLFTVRVAGNVLGSAQVASIEYAIEHLGAKLIVVMGHESCGAVKAAIDHAKSGKKAHLASTDLDWLVGAIEPNIGGRQLASVSSTFDSRLRKPVMANVDSVSENLLLRSKIVSKAVAEGKAKLVRGIYSLESGQVDFWGLK
jgi:carbonic anhydrase